MGIQFCWTESDYVTARIAWLLHRPWKIIQGYWYSLLLLCMVLVAFIIKPANWKLLLLYALLSVAVTIPSLLLMRWRWHRQFQESPLANAEMIADIEERGITLSAHGGKKTHSWVGFSQIYESRHIVMLEKGDSDYLFLLKRAMNGGHLIELTRFAASASNCKVKLSTAVV